MHRLFTLLLPIALLLGGLVSASAQALSRGPYLQMGNTSAVTVRWRTSVPTNSVVRYGTSPGNLDLMVSDSIVETEHRVRLTGLSANTKYYYSIGNSYVVLAGGEECSFVTSPTEAKPTRIWVLGDSGTADDNQRAVRDAYYNFTGERHTDLWLMLGDNAYNVGTDAEYQRAVFDIYQAMLKKSVLWSTLGNHDGFSASSASQTGPYYDIFTLPQQGEAGGIASGTEAYYSFDYGNIHFVCLDSYGTDRSSTGTMATWLRNDLAETAKDWVIAFFHHPPYSKGSHDSDLEWDLVEMRQEILPILEEYGVDLVLTGHSHSYERSQFIDGHYGPSSTFNSSMVVQDGSGRVDDTGAYTKSAIGPQSHAGAVYAVAGASGKISGGLLNHPAMYLSLNVLGSMVIDVDGDRLDVQYIDDTGARQDHFTLIKGGAGNTAPTVNITNPGEGAVIVLPAEITVEADAHDADGSISKVEFYAGSTLIGTDTSAPYSTVWSDAPAGEHSLTAVATDNLGTARTSATVSVTVNSSTPSTTVTFRNGVKRYAGTRDTKLRASAAKKSFGRSTSLEVNGNPKQQRALLKWDLSSIPPGSQVTGVTLTFNITNRTFQSYEIYGMRREWSESSATWNSARKGESWQLAGAQGPEDRGHTVLGSIGAAGVGSRTVTLNAQGLALVQAWVNDPGKNHGFIIMNHENFDGLSLSSSETGSIGKRPKITVTYR